MSKNKASSEKCDYIFKFVILGDSAVGKTNLLLRFTDTDYKQTHIPTIGVDFKVKIVTIDNKSVKMQLWDTAGQQRFRTITETYYKGASGVVLVYSVNDRRSFQNINNWMTQIQQRQDENTPKIIVGNKCDLENKERCVTTAQGKELAARYGVQFIQSSAKTGFNVTNVFQILGRMCMQKAGIEDERQQSTMASQLDKPRRQGKKKRFDCCQM